MYLGLDLGTSGLRGLLMDDAQSIIASAEAHYDVMHPHAGWSEQNPSDWVAALHDVIGQIKSRHPKAVSALRGIGVSGHMHGATCLNANGDVIRPCILWNDTRAHAEAAQLDTTDRIQSITGNIVFPGFTAPKLMWIAHHEPDVFSHITKVLLPKDYMNFILTGRYVGDMSDSAGTAWLDTGARGWSDTALSAGGMHRNHMPDLVEGSEIAGTLQSELAETWGISKDCIVVGGGGDNAVAACGVGALNEGDGFVSLGTSGVMLAAKDSYAPMPETAVHTFCHAVPNRWYQMGVTLAATDSLNWLAGIIDRTPADLTADLGPNLMAPTSIGFAPYLSGERTPHNDSAVRGGFSGLSIGSSAKDMTHAVLQGVCFAQRDSYAALKSTGTQLQSALAIGGGTKSMLWVEMLATILDLPLELPEQGDFGAALGAARLAMAGVTGHGVDDIMTKPKIQNTIEPNATHAAAYQDAYANYGALYAAFKDLS